MKVNWDAKAPTINSELLKNEQAVKDHSKTANEVIEGYDKILSLGESIMKIAN